MLKLINWLKSAFSWPDIEPIEEPQLRQLAWGRKMSPACRDKVFSIADDLVTEPDHIMAVIAFESAETFRPDIKNFAGSGATGLIQFMPATARGLGTSVEALAKMTVLEQLDWVHAYFRPYRGKMKTLSDVYMAVLWPKAVGKPEDYVLWTKATMPTTYRQNAGLDANKDGLIKKNEAAAKVAAKLEAGRLAPNLWEGV
ncbi:transglycosylase SLT domain-containing protein [Pusillimonas minor]|uniref:Transglycosylase SLT domain-containing protein n=1 Tax=Pusillimonas minor TaxID=2697024 RepID=A0A842HMQ6_9BURK|nr:transglycosylase SLT domain-containing protein [Pusillimonas minor]MBC2768551.1 transglycosylase SLT domain-containing protein [Pusillimonas minor]